jgi:PhzF family phenazine biosynthesis protein
LDRAQAAGRYLEHAGQVTRSVGVHLVSVFPDGPGGGNPAPVVIDAAGLADADMRAIASAYGHESVFVLPPPDGSDCQFTFRFFVPHHEMEMCGHATLGAVWLLKHLDKLPGTHIRIATLSGMVEAQVAPGGIEISQPKGKLEALKTGELTREILAVLGIDETTLAPQPIQNARTSRTKTLIPLKGVAILDGLRPDFGRIAGICEAIGSTGLYPFAVSDAENWIFDARQFPKSSGYPEDAATGIAAAALAFGLLENGQISATGPPVKVRQGRAMGRPSEIRVRFRMDEAGAVQGCWLGGDVRFETGR